MSCYEPVMTGDQQHDGGHFWGRVLPWFFDGRTRFVLWRLALKDLKAKYKSAVLGLLWTAIQPLLTMVVLSLVFSYVMRITATDYAVLVLSGLVAWQYHSTVIQSGTTAFVDNSDLLKKLAFPRSIVPASVVLTNLVHLAVAIPVYIVVASALGFEMSWHFVLIVPAVFLHTLFLLGWIFLTASLHVHFRDMKYIMLALLQAWFYLSPVLYPVSMIPEKWHSLYHLNPGANIVELYRSALYSHSLPEPLHILNLMIWTLGLGVVGTYLYRRFSPNFADHV